MAEDSAPAKQESSKDTVRTKALKRLAAAGAVTVAALAGLWWLDQSGEKQVEKKPPAPSPILTAPAPIITAPEAPLAEDAPPEAPLPTEAQPTAAPQESPQDNAPSAPPPPPRASQAARASTVPASEVRPPISAPAEESARPPRAQRMASTQPASTRLPEKPILADAAPPAGRGYVVQLGVFTNPKNAQELVQRLQSLGIRAYTETRVHVGPFLSEDEAEKARLAMQRHGIKGVVGATK